MQGIRRKIRQHLLVIIVVTIMTATYAVAGIKNEAEVYDNGSTTGQVLNQQTSQTPNMAGAALELLEVKGRAPKTGYSRQQFGGGWGTVNSCDTRNMILQRDLRDITLKIGDGCTVTAGTLDDPYTGEVIHFRQGHGSSQAVQIDHVVALSDSWQKGAQALSVREREILANDPINLLAVDGPTNVKRATVMRLRGCPLTKITVAVMSPGRSPSRQNTGCGSLLPKGMP